jgi:CHASE3 domain sensor protein
MDAETKTAFDDMKASISEMKADMDRRFDAVDKQIGQAVELIQALATGTSARFDALERKIDDGQPPLKLLP